MPNERSNEIIEVSKAIQAAAKTSSEAVGVVRETGSFLNRVFGELVEDGVGIVADRIKFYRLKNYIALCENTLEKMHQKGLFEGGSTQTVPLKISIPLIEHATLEDDINLQDYWAQMLANAMDPNFETNVERRHVSLLSDMEPLDLRILNAVCSQYHSDSERKALEDVLFDKSEIVDAFKVTERQIEVSLLNLMRLGCIKPGNLKTTSFSVEGEINTIYKGTDQFHLSLLGLELFQAAMTS